MHLSSGHRSAPRVHKNWSNLDLTNSLISPNQIQLKPRRSPDPKGKQKGEDLSNKSASQITCARTGPKNRNRCSNTTVGSRVKRKKSNKYFFPQAPARRRRGSGSGEWPRFLLLDGSVRKLMTRRSEQCSPPTSLGLLLLVLVGEDMDSNKLAPLTAWASLTLVKPSLLSTAGEVPLLAHTSTRWNCNGKELAWVPLLGTEEKVDGYVSQISCWLASHSLL
jgi:hypothetical protein